ncbi:hypothetical protein PD374_22080 [Pseudomonas sp. WCS374]|nr:hypothetical protein PD374_22080 [Pseudomonas sp. WCS374]
MPQVELHQVAGLGAVGGKLRQVLGVGEVEVSVKTKVRRCGFVVDIELGQIRFGFFTRWHGFVEGVAQGLADSEAIKQQVTACAGFFIP